MFDSDPFDLDPQPNVVREHLTEYTGGEIHALIAPIMGLDPEDIKAVVIIADLGEMFTFGGTAGVTGSKAILCDAVTSGVLNTPDPDLRDRNNPGLS